MFSAKEVDTGRFEVLYLRGTVSGEKILWDKETGIQYLLAWSGNASGLTPLLDKEGRPIRIEKPKK